MLKTVSLYADDAASMALPNGHAASTNASPYCTFFTSVISWDGSRAGIKQIKGSELYLNQKITNNKYVFYHCHSQFPMMLGSAT